jgi:hypothetical protein
MATSAYRDNGVIIIWWDETEGGDDPSRTLPEIVISPLAKGNAYASTLPMNHSSDVKTWGAVFGLPELDNPIPAAETNAFGGHNDVATVNDLSDLFVPGTIPTWWHAAGSYPSVLPVARCFPSRRQLTFMSPITLIAVRQRSRNQSIVRSNAI